MLARLLLLAALAAPLCAQDDDVDKYLEELRAGKPAETKAQQQQLLAALTKNLEGITDPGQKASVFLRISEVYESLHDPDAAIAAARKARELAPEDARFATGLARVLLAHGETAEVAPLIGVDPTDGGALIRRAWELTRQPGNDLLAAFCAELAHKLRPDDLSVTEALGSIYLQGGMPASAIRAFGELVEKAPLVSTHHYQLGRALSMNGNPDFARLAFQDALALNPPAGERLAIQNLLANLPQ